MSILTINNFLPTTLYILVAMLPISLLSGSLIINTFHFLISIIFLIEIFKTKKFYFFQNKIFYMLFFFWISLLINLIFSINPESGTLRSVGFVRIILIIFAIKYIFSYENYKYKNNILKVWFIIFIIVSIDLLIEFIFGRNILGYSSYIPGRLAGFLDSELKIGGYYLGFILISLTYIIYKYGKKNYLLLIFFLLTFFIISFLIGERSNFIKITLLIFFFSLIYFKDHIIKFLIIFSCSFVILFGFIFNNDDLKYRYYEQLKAKKLEEYYYFQHYKSAIVILKEHPIFGVGIKNFRNEILNKKYEKDQNWNNRHIKSTHPHQINFEILSETGIFGFTCYALFFFLSLIKSFKEYLKNKNLLLLSSIIFIVVSLNPILPSGSFFTTYSSTIFWINYAIMITFSDYKKDQLIN